MKHSAQMGSVSTKNADLSQKRSLESFHVRKLGFQHPVGSIHMSVIEPFAKF